MKENYQIYLPYQFHRRPHSVDWDAQLSHKKMKTMFLSNMSKSRRLTSTFFPIRTYNFLYLMKPTLKILSLGHLLTMSIPEIKMNQEFRHSIQISVIITRIPVSPSKLLSCSRVMSFFFMGGTVGGRGSMSSTFSIRFRRILIRRKRTKTNRKMFM